MINCNYYIVMFSAYDEDFLASLRIQWISAEYDWIM